MTDVVSLRGDPIPAPDAGDPVIVEILEKWLQRARNGQLTNVAIAGVYRDGDAGSAWAGTVDNALIGSVHLMVHDLTETVIAGGRWKG